MALGGLRLLERKREREIKPFMAYDSKSLMWTHIETMTGSNYSLVIYENTDELRLSAMQT